MRDNTLITEVFDLHFAGSAFCEDSPSRGCVQGRLEPLGYGPTQGFVFLLHAKGAGQTAASGIQVRDLRVTEFCEQGK